MTGRHIDNAAGNEERRYLAHASGQHFAVIVCDGLDATDTGTQCDTDPVPVFFGDLETGIPDSLDRGAHTVMNERIILPLIFLRKIGVNVEALHHSRNASRVSAGVEVLNEKRTGISFANVSPGIIQGAAYR